MVLGSGGTSYVNLNGLKSNYEKLLEQASSFMPKASLPSADFPNAAYFYAKKLKKWTPFLPKMQTIAKKVTFTPKPSILYRNDAIFEG